MKLLQGIKIDRDDIINIIQEVRRTRGGALLDPDDIISEVLDNDDFVTIGMFEVFFFFGFLVLFKAFYFIYFLVLTTDKQINMGKIPDELKYVLEPMYPFF